MRMLCPICDRWFSNKVEDDKRGICKSCLEHDGMQDERKEVEKIAGKRIERHN